MPKIIENIIFLFKSILRRILVEPKNETSTGVIGSSKVKCAARFASKITASAPSSLIRIGLNDTSGILASAAQGHGWFAGATPGYLKSRISAVHVSTGSTRTD